MYHLNYSIRCIDFMTSKKNKSKLDKARVKMVKKIAIVDIGSNTVRLVIYRVKSENAIKVIENIKIAARLQTYLNADLVLNSEGIKILVDSLNVFKEMIALHNVESTKIFATAAIRSSRNIGEIKQIVNDKTGFSIDVLTGEEEAKYGFLGVISSTDKNDGITVDLGGGSLEITQFRNRKMVHSYSFSFGVLSLKQQFLPTNKPTDTELTNLAAYIQSQIQSIDWLKDCQLPIIGIGGSARSIGAIDQVMKSYPINSVHLYEIDKGDLDSVKERVKSLSFNEIQTVLGLSKERAEIVFPAVEVFLGIYRTVNAPILQISEKGLRDGVLFAHLKLNGSFQKKLSESLREISFEYDIDLDKRELVFKTALMLFESLKAVNTDLIEEDIQDLHRASYLYNLGEVLERDYASAHSFYILSNRNFLELPHRDWIKIALLASFQSKAAFKENISPYKNWFEKNERRKLRLLGSILKFAFVLNNTKREIIQEIHCKDEGEFIQLEIVCIKQWMAEEKAAEKQIKHLENALEKRINLHFTMAD